MKNTLLFFIFPFVGFAQVGVHNSNPQQALHVGGANSSIKIEGLNAENNIKNLGAGSKTRVFVNSEGDLILGDTEDNITFILDVENYIPDDEEEKVVQTGTGENFSPLAENENYPVVTMASEGIMEINYSISWRIERNNNQKISDGSGRTVRTIVYVKNANTGQYLMENGAKRMFAITGQFYANNNRNKGADKYFYNTGSDYIDVPAGDYQIIFGGLVNSGGNENIFVYFGGDKDQMQIIAHY